MNNDLVYKQRAFNLPGIKTDITNHCRVPWNSVSVDNKGRVFVCFCDGFVPFHVGIVTDFETFDDIFNSPKAKEIQQSILDRNFKYCATDVCGIKFKDLGKDDKITLNLNIDISCNLTCPSCRESMVFINDAGQLADKFLWVMHLKKWITTTDRAVSIELAGGEPFASLLYTRVIDELIDEPNVTFRIRTNGTLISNRKHVVEKLLDKVDWFTVSIDAATKPVFEKIRRGGRWEQLINNLEYLKSLNKSCSASFVIQKSNIDDVIPFVDFCRQYNLTPNYSVLQDWGTWHNFNEQCVHIPESTDYTKFKSILERLQTITDNTHLIGLSAFI